MHFVFKIAVFLLIQCYAVSIVHSRGHAKLRQNHNGEQPEKIDLAIIVDESEAMETRHLRSAIKLIFKLAKYFSLSPGTTRVGLYTVGNEFKTHFEFRDHVNRECLMKSMKELVLKTSPRNKNFTENLRAGFEEIKSKHTDIEGQRHIYLYITNKHDDTKLMASELDLEAGDEVNVLLFGKIPKKRRHHENKILKKKDASVAGTYYSPSPQENVNPVNRHNIEVEKTAGKQIKIIDLPTQIEHILYKINIENKVYGRCLLRKEGRKVVDECDRHCTCKNGKLVDCFRVRKEFTSMKSKERRRYLRAYKTLTTKSPYKETYERFIFMHYKYFCWGIHSGDLFLPWHRWFLSIMEDLLRQIDCGVTIPYWDWSHVSRDPWNRTNLWRSTDDGLGSNGNRFKGYCVQKGIFRESEWKTPYWEDPMDIILSSADQLEGDFEDQSGHLAFCLRRAFKGHTPSYESVQRTLLIPARNFKDFDIQIRHNFHDRVHNVIGGTMCTHYAGNTPEFHLHHSFLDKIWYTWQLKSPDHKWVHFLQRNHTKMMGTEYTHFEYINTDNLPRCIKIKYQDFPKHVRNKRDIDIDSMRRMPDLYWEPYLEESWYSSFPNCSRSKKEKKRAKYLHKVLDGPGPIKNMIP